MWGKFFAGLRTRAFAAETCCGGLAAGIGLVLFHRRNQQWPTREGQVPEPEGNGEAMEPAVQSTADGECHIPPSAPASTSEGNTMQPAVPPSPVSPEDGECSLPPSPPASTSEGNTMQPAVPPSPVSPEDGECSLPPSPPASTSEGNTMQPAVPPSPVSPEDGECSLPPSPPASTSEGNAMQPAVPPSPEDGECSLPPSPASTSEMEWPAPLSPPRAVWWENQFLSETGNTNYTRMRILTLDGKVVSRPASSQASSARPPRQRKQGRGKRP